MPDISMPDISPNFTCMELLSKIPPIIPFTSADALQALQKEINNYYDKCGQIEKKKRVTTLNADRKKITLTDACILPKKMGRRKYKDDAITGEITEAKKEQEINNKEVGEKDKIDEKTLNETVEAEAYTSVFSELLENLVNPNPSKKPSIKKSTTRSARSASAATVTTDRAPTASAATVTTARAPTAFGAPAPASFPTARAPTAFGAPAPASFHTARPPTRAPTPARPTSFSNAASFGASSLGDSNFTDFNPNRNALESQPSDLSCGRHALNNLLRGPFFTFDTKVNTDLRLNQIPTQPPINLQQVCISLQLSMMDETLTDPEVRRRLITECPSTENYDILILTAALNLVGYDVKQEDKFANLVEYFDYNSNFDYNSSGEILLLLNQLSGTTNRGLHWIAVRKYNGDNTVYSYDSLKKSPNTYTTIGQFSKKIEPLFDKYRFFIVTQSESKSPIDPTAVYQHPGPATAAQPPSQTSPFAASTSTPFGTQSFTSFSSSASTFRTQPFPSFSSAAAPFAATSPQQFQFSASTSALQTPPSAASPSTLPVAPPPTSTPFTAPPPTSAPFTSTASPSALQTPPESTLKAQSPNSGIIASKKGTDKKNDKYTSALKRKIPEQYNVDLRVDENIQRENIQRSKKQKKELEGGSPMISIPTPSKTRKSHQRKRSHYSSKSTFKRRKYTEE